MLGIGFLLAVQILDCQKQIAEGNSRQLQGAYAAAEAAYRRALELAPMFGPASRPYAMVLNNMATLDYRLGRWQAAKAGYGKAIEQWASLGATGEEAAAQSNLAELAVAQGDFATAIDLTGKALEARRVLGVKASNTLCIRGNALRALGRLAEAREAFEQAIAAGDGDGQASARLNRAQLDLSAGNFAEARRDAEWARNYYRDTGRHRSVLYANATAAIGRIARADGDTTGAERHCRESLAVLEAALGPEHQRLIPALVDLAELLRARSRAAEGYALLERAERLGRTKLGENHRDYAAIVVAMADTKRVLGHLDDSERLYRKAIGAAERTLPVDAAQLAPYLNNYAALLADQNRHAEAEGLFREALRIREQALGPMSIDCAETLFNLATVVVAAGRPADARPLLERSLAVRQQFYGDSHPSLLPTLSAYVGVLRATNDKRRVRDMEARVAAIAAAQPETKHKVDFKTLRSAFR